MQAGEDCDDGNQVLDTICDAACHFTCVTGWWFYLNFTAPKATWSDN